jgi:hypothetical protein
MDLPAGAAIVATPIAAFVASVIVSAISPVTMRAEAVPAPALDGAAIAKRVRMTASIRLADRLYRGRRDHDDRQG